MKNIRRSFLAGSLIILLLSCSKQAVLPADTTEIHWSVSGSALTDSARLHLVQQPNGSWAIAWPLRQGKLRFVNDRNVVSYGGKNENVLSPDAADIAVESAGNYTLEVNPSKTGDYTYTIQRLRFP